jgi:5'-3' exonuclease
LKSLLDILGIKYIHAKGESDSLCSYLYRHNVIDACLSDDMDILVSGCKRLIKIDNKKIIHYSLDNILKKLELNYEQFLKFIIFFGCDYVKPIQRLDLDQILKLIKEERELSYIVDFINEQYLTPKNDQIEDQDINRFYRTTEEYENAIYLFKTAQDKEYLDEKLDMAITCKIDKKQIFDLLDRENVEDNVFLNRVNLSLNKINQYISKNVYVDLDSHSDLGDLK